MQIQIPKYVESRSFIGYVMFTTGVNILIGVNANKQIKQVRERSTEQWRYVANLLNRHDVELDDFDLMALPVALQEVRSSKSRSPNRASIFLVRVKCMSCNEKRLLYVILDASVWTTPYPE